MLSLPRFLWALPLLAATIGCGVSQEELARQKALSRKPAAFVRLLNLGEKPAQLVANGKKVGPVMEPESDPLLNLVKPGSTELRVEGGPPRKVELEPSKPLTLVFLPGATSYVVLEGEARNAAKGTAEVCFAALAMPGADAGGITATIRGVGDPIKLEPAKVSSIASVGPGTIHVSFIGPRGMKAETSIEAGDQDAYTVVALVQNGKIRPRVLRNHPDRSFSAAGVAPG
jgi:hypothetical protein